MNIAIACDSRGWQMKEQLKQFLTEQGHEVSDFGAFNAASSDYPDFAYPCAKAVADGKCQFGIVVCFTGIGVSIVANKVKGVRCALCVTSDMAEMTRMHNNSNMLAMGAKYVNIETACEIVQVFLSTQFEGGRHQARVNKITQIENDQAD